jgi:hypothetical protein
LLNRLLKIWNVLIGLILSPFYVLEERERERKLRERIERLRRKETR